ncbi:ribokinase [Brevibacterium sanguinis]|uniref:Ribokinase n=2 Tax=Brevibacterium TaxID=1696 RepID=A0A366IRF4_9MICO|nr:MULTISPECIES: PfkB family carbohydrate kinase [Brevibacterium]RBP68023.1 ribokinase [Brevibacterium sanguinis]RBP74560.1 ribokinase [Brevibacterium celere]
MNLDLTVVGSINADITALVDRLPTAGETVGGGRLVHSAGGKGANQAAAAARLGARTRMIGAVGSDATGREMTGALAAAGVDISCVEVVDDETGTALIMVDAQGENLIAVCEGANARVGIDGIEFGEHETVLTQLEISLDLVAELARKVRGYFVVNAAPALTLPAEVVDRADLVIVNETEYELLDQLRSARRVAVTYGASGSALFDHGERVAFAPALPTTPVSTVGAGDAFCAALTIGLRSGLAPSHALRAANAVGAAAVRDPAAQPSFEPLDAYL